MAVTDTEQLSFEHGALAFSALAMGDGPVVLCLHGFPDNAGSFRHQLPALAEAGYRAISLTLRGYEPGSIPVDGDYTMETIATDILAVIESLDMAPCIWLVTIGAPLWPTSQPLPHRSGLRV